LPYGDEADTDGGLAAGSAQGRLAGSDGIGVDGGCALLGDDDGLMYVERDDGLLDGDGVSTDGSLAAGSAQGRHVGSDEIGADGGCALLGDIVISVEF
jgi:hypothetical protein